MDQEEKKKVKQMKDRARKKAQRARDKENFDDWMRKRLVLNEREKTRYHKVRCSLDAEGQAEQKQKWKESKRKFRERKALLSCAYNASAQVVVEPVQPPPVVDDGSASTSNNNDDDLDPFASEETALNFFVNWNTDLLPK